MQLKEFIKKERVILAISFLVFAISVAYSFYFRITPAVDARTYDQIAMNLISGNGYKIDKNISYYFDEAITYQGPSYPFFLSGIYLIFGHHYEAVWIIQALIRALSAFLLFLICVKIFSFSGLENEAGRKAGWIAAALFGFYPDLIEIGAMLMTETIFIFLLIVITYIFARNYEKFNLLSVFSLSLIFGLAILTRSTVGLFFLPFLFYFLRRRQIKYALLFIFFAAVILIPWTARNYRVYHVFLPTMANGGYGLYAGNHVGGDGEGGVPPNHQEIIKQFGIIGANNYNMAQFKIFLKDHFFEYIKLTLERIIKYFSFIRPMGFWFYQHGFSQFVFILFSAASSVILFTFGFAGIFSFLPAKADLKKEQRNLAIYLAVFVFLTFLAVIPIVVETRYRLPIYPFMAVFAGFFIVKVLALKKEYSGHLVKAFAILFSFSVINIIIEFDKIIEKLGQIWT